ncbi:MAG: tRNA adenosine(34) deaminase TadA [Bacillota bacterium]
MNDMDEHEQFMQEALRLAERAARRDEVPVGAVVVRNGKIIARGYNLRETKRSPLAHAEIVAIHKAAKRLGGWRLSGCTLYVTLEPCPMCAGAIINARIDSVVFGAYDPKAGALGSLYNLAEGKLNHTPLVTGGVLKEACAALLKQYFTNKRK